MKLQRFRVVLALLETLKPAISNLVKIATERPELLRPGSGAGVSVTQSH